MQLIIKDYTGRSNKTISEFSKKNDLHEKSSSIFNRDLLSKQGTSFIIKKSSVIKKSNKTTTLLKAIAIGTLILLSITAGLGAFYYLPKSSKETQLAIRENLDTFINSCRSWQKPKSDTQYETNIPPCNTGEIPSNSSSTVSGSF